MKQLFIIYLSTLMSACAINSGVVPLNNNTYTITKQAATGFSGIEGVREDVLQDANKFCVSMGKNLKIWSTYETKPPYIFGNFPRAFINFKCEDFEKPVVSKSISNLNITDENSKILNSSDNASNGKITSNPQKNESIGDNLLIQDKRKKSIPIQTDNIQVPVLNPKTGKLE
jgi:hypothetical protein